MATLDIWGRLDHRNTTRTEGLERKQIKKTTKLIKILFGTVLTDHVPQNEYQLGLSRSCSASSCPVKMPLSLDGLYSVSVFEVFVSMAAACGSNGLSFDSTSAFAPGNGGKSAAMNTGTGYSVWSVTLFRKSVKFHIVLYQVLSDDVSTRGGDAKPGQLINRFNSTWWHNLPQRICSSCSLPQVVVASLLESTCRLLLLPRRHCCCYCFAQLVVVEEILLNLAIANDNSTDLSLLGPANAKNIILLRGIFHLHYTTRTRETDSAREKRPMRLRAPLFHFCKAQ